LITDGGRGLLVDWDLCKDVKGLAAAARQREHPVSLFCSASNSVVTRCICACLGNMEIHVRHVIDELEGRFDHVFDIGWGRNMYEASGVAFNEVGGLAWDLV
jgi:hypothetical protein